MSTHVGKLKTLQALVLAAFAAAIVLVSMPSSARDGPDPPGARNVRDVRDGADAPRARMKSKRKVYGSPIQPPIMGKRKSAHHKSQANKAAAAGKKTGKSHDASTKKSKSTKAKATPR